jgi:hypothetical protein
MPEAVCNMCGRDLTNETNCGGDCIYCTAWLVNDPECMMRLRSEAIRSLGFALFNLSKGKIAATEVLIHNAHYALTGYHWDEKEMRIN